MDLVKFCADKENGFYPLKKCVGFVKCIKEIVPCRSGLVFDVVGEKCVVPSQVVTGEE